MPRDEPAPARWYSVDPLRVAVLAGLVAAWVALYGVLRYRAAVEAIPEPGRATPIEELRAAWAESDEEEKLAETRRIPITMPERKPERRP